jgi:outer membrane protein TolC
MNPFGHVLTVTLFAVAGTTAFGTPVTLTLHDAIDRALTQNLSLRRTQTSLAAAQRQEDHAWAILLPKVSASTGLSRANYGQTVLGVTAEPSTYLSASASVSVTLSSAILTKFETLELSLRSQQLVTDSARRSIEKSIHLLWASLLLEQANIHLAEDNLARQSQNLEDIRAQFKVGLAPDVDLLGAEVSTESLRPKISALQTNFENDVGRLNILLGFPLDQKLVLSGNLDERWEDLVTTPNELTTASSSVRQAELQLESARESLRSQQRLAYWPTATLSWTTTPTVPLKSGGAWSDSQGLLSLGLSFSVDGALPWGTQAESLVEASETVTTDESQLVEAQMDSALKKQSAQRLILQSIQSIHADLLNRELAQKNYDRTQEAYRHGTKDFLSLQNAASDLSQAQFTVLSERVSLLTAVRDLEDESGLPFGTLLGGVE